MLLPGLDGTGLFFEPLLKALPSSHAVRVISFPTDKMLGYEQLSVLVTSHLPDGPIILLGESFSGPLAAIIAHENQTWIRGLILAASFVSSPKPRFLRHFLPFPGLPQLGKKLARLALLGRYSNPEIVGLLKQIIPGLPARLVRFRAELVLNADYGIQLQSTRCPVLILNASEDFLVSQRSAQQLKKLRPDAIVATLPAPHMLLQTRPKECAKEISNFIANLSMAP